MFYVAIVLQWLHILCAIGWFGSSLAFTLLVVPALARVGQAGAQGFFAALAPATRRYFGTLGGLTILFGIARGLALGLSPATAYGVTFIAAIVLGGAMAGFGARVTNATVERLAAVPVDAEGGPEFEREFGRLRVAGRIELVGFAVLVALMVAMRFGY